MWLLYYFFFVDGPEENSSKLLSTPFIEDPQHRLKWTAYLEFTHNNEVGDLTWDKVKAYYLPWNRFVERHLCTRFKPHCIKILVPFGCFRSNVMHQGVYQTLRNGTLLFKSKRSKLLDEKFEREREKWCARLKALSISHFGDVPHILTMSRFRDYIQHLCMEVGIHKTFDIVKMCVRQHPPNVKLRMSCTRLWFLVGFIK